MSVTFKKTPKTGRYRSFEKDHTEIKFHGKVIGAIRETDGGAYSVSIMSTDKPSNENCPWRWVTFSKKFGGEQAARDWFKTNALLIRERYPFHKLEG